MSAPAICTCIVCGKKLQNLSENSLQPAGGLALHSSGHYGSAAFDPMDGSVVEVVVCDECFVKAPQHIIHMEGWSG